MKITRKNVAQRKGEQTFQEKVLQEKSKKRKRERERENASGNIWSVLKWTTRRRPVHSLNSCVPLSLSLSLRHQVFSRNKPEKKSAKKLNLKKTKKRLHKTTTVVRVVLTFRSFWLVWVLEFFKTWTDGL